MAKQRTKFALLGLLGWKPMSGYDIKKLVDVGLSHFWKENYGQIYPTLDALVREGFATKREDRASRQRKRFVYSITPAGKKAFRQWLAEPTDTPVVRNELQLKFFLSDSLPTAESVRLVREYQQQQQAALADYRRSERVLRRAIDEGEISEELEQLLGLTLTRLTPQRRTNKCQTFWLSLRHGIRTVEARLAWCKEVLQMLEKNGP